MVAIHIQEIVIEKNKNSSPLYEQSINIFFPSFCRINLDFLLFFLSMCNILLRKTTVCACQDATNQNNQFLALLFLFSVVLFISIYFVLMMLFLIVVVVVVCIFVLYFRLIHAIISSQNI